jgi:hypothetical protein
MLLFPRKSQKQFQIQDFDKRSSVVAQLRPLTQLSTTIKDNTKMPEIEPCAGGVCSRSVSAWRWGRHPALSIFGDLGGGSAIAHQPQPPDPGSHEAIDPKSGIAEE